MGDILEDAKTTINQTIEFYALIAEVERLRSDTVENLLMISSRDELVKLSEKKIESLTKERDELKKDWDQYESMYDKLSDINKKLEAENSALKTRTEFDWAHRQKVEAENAKLKEDAEIDVNIERCVFTDREGEQIFSHKIKPGNKLGEVEIKTLTKINIVGYRILPLEDFKKLEEKLATSEKARKDAEEQIARDPECGDL